MHCEDYGVMTINVLVQEVQMYSGAKPNNMRRFHIRTTTSCMAAAFIAAILCGSIGGICYNHSIAGVTIDRYVEDRSASALPSVSYSSRHFNSTKNDSVRSIILVPHTDSSDDSTESEINNDGNNSCQEPSIVPFTEYSNGSDLFETRWNGDLHEPKCQHLLVDIENVKSSFLFAEEQLAHAMLTVVKTSGLTVLSYHCHSLASRSVNCVGVLLESHIALHTFPTAGVITLDLFTCGPGSLVPLVPLIKKLFGIPRDDVIEERPEAEVPHLTWTHKLRGFDLQEHNFESRDYHAALGTSGTHKEHVLSKRTMFQSVDILDVGQSRFLSQTSSKSIELEAGGSLQLNRLLYLDGVIQSSRFGESAYHESLVHPAMFTHKNPKRVAIIGGGEGATLREVLKHESVEKVVMLEIDGELMNLAREYLPEWNDCSNIAGGTECCFDDPRAEVYATDAISWLIERFPEDTAKAGSDPEEGFDVIIMDALDPSSLVSFSDMLYNNDAFTTAISNALGDSGIFVVQVGESDSQGDLPSTHDRMKYAFIDQLVHAKFGAIQNYEEMHSRFGGVWSFVLAFKDSDDRGLWLQNQAEFNLLKREKILDSVDGTPLLRFFDGATMLSYQFPNRVVENLWCLDHEDVCKGGHGFDTEIANSPVSSFEVRTSDVDGAGRGVYATQNITKGSYIGAEQCVEGMFVPATTFSILKSAHDTFRTTFYDIFFNAYVHGYGWIDMLHGEAAAGVDTSILTYVNHGCNSTYNMGVVTPFNEQDLMVDAIPDTYDDQFNDEFDPFTMRSFPAWGCNDESAIRNIKSGEELLDNYLVFGVSSDEDDPENDFIVEVKQMCAGLAGFITEYEHSRVEKYQQSSEQHLF